MARGVLGVLAGIEDRRQPGVRDVYLPAEERARTRLLALLEIFSLYPQRADECRDHREIEHLGDHGAYDAPHDQPDDRQDEHRDDARLAQALCIQPLR